MGGGGDTGRLQKGLRAVAASTQPGQASPRAAPAATPQPRVPIVQSQWQAPGQRREEIALTQPLASTEVSKKPSRRPRRSPRPACHGGGRERSPKGDTSHSVHHARYTAQRPPGAALRAASNQREIKTSPGPPQSLATGAPQYRQV